MKEERHSKTMYKSVPSEMELLHKSENTRKYGKEGKMEDKSSREMMKKGMPGNKNIKGCK